MTQPTYSTLHGIVQLRRPMAIVLEQNALRLPIDTKNLNVFLTWDKLSMRMYSAHIQAVRLDLRPRTVTADVWFEPKDQLPATPGQLTNCATCVDVLYFDPATMVVIDLDVNSSALCGPHYWHPFEVVQQPPAVINSPPTASVPQTGGPLKRKPVKFVVDENPGCSPKFDNIRSDFDYRPAATPATCVKCFGTGFVNGFGGPCPHGCKP